MIDEHIDELIFLEGEFLLFIATLGSLFLELIFIEVNLSLDVTEDELFGEFVSFENDFS